jgi:hypothetical protein
MISPTLWPGEVLANMELALPAQAFEERPAGLAALALVPAGAGKRLVERRFGPGLEEEWVYSFEADIDDIASPRPPTGLLRVAAAQDSLGWLAWADAKGLAATPRLALHESMLLELPPGPRVITSAIEANDHDLTVYVLMPAHERTEIFACRFGAPLEVVDPPDPDDPDDWDDTDLVPGEARCELIGSLVGSPIGECSIAQVPGSGEVRLVVPLNREADYCLAHLVILDGRAELSAIATYSGIHPIPGGAAAFYVDETGRSNVAAIGARPVEGVTDADRGSFEPLLLTARFTGVAVEQQAVPCGSPIPAMPRAAAVAFSSVTNERPLCRAALVDAGGAVLLSGSDGRLCPVTLMDPVIEPLALIVTRKATHVGIATRSGPLLVAIQVT